MNNYVNSPDGIRSLVHQLPENAHCVLEATGSYSVLLAYMLSQAKVTMSVINPKQIGPPKRPSLRENAFIGYQD